MNKSMRSWNDLEAGVVVEDAEVAVVVDGDADARVRVLAEVAVHGEPASLPHSRRGLQGQHKGHGRNHVKTGPSVRHVCAHRKCVAVRDRARAMSARVRSARQWEPCAFAGDTASVLGWAHNLMFRYTGWWLVLSN